MIVVPFFVQYLGIPKGYNLLYDEVKEIQERKATMKIRLLCVMLAAAFWLTGCTSQKNENDTVENPLVQHQGESMEVSEEKEEEPYTLTFTGTTIDGEVLTSDCLTQSKFTMINVWATYCNPCLAEMPDLGELASSYEKEEFQMLGIISDVAEGAGETDMEYAKELITKTGAEYPHLLLNESLYVNLVGAVDAVPTTFFVNQKGEPVGYVVGAQTKETWEEIINDLLAENQ